MAKGKIDLRKAAIILYGYRPKIHNAAMPYHQPCYVVLTIQERPCCTQ